jgi:Uma2 family endonuclease
MMTERMLYAWPRPPRLVEKRMARTELAARPAAPLPRMTYEEFLDWCDEDTWAEWIDGEVVVLSPASSPHQKIVGLLFTLVNLFAKVHHLGTVFSAPYQMKLGPARGGSGREPDLVFVAGEHEHRILPGRLEGPADLVVEVVSPTSRQRDRVDKFREYEAAGVGEYWLIERDRKQADFFGLGPDGRYQALLVQDGIFRSRVLPGFWLRIEWLWQDPTPELQALRELGLLGS